MSIQLPGSKKGVERRIPRLRLLLTETSNSFDWTVLGAPPSEMMLRYDATNALLSPCLLNVLALLDR